MEYRPPRLLRNAHVQSALAGLRPRALALGRGDEARAENPLPDPVHINPGGERMTGFDERFGQGEPV